MKHQFLAAILKNCDVGPFYDVYLVHVSAGFICKIVRSVVVSFSVTLLSHAVI